VPKRVLKPATGFVYHVYNRGVARQSTFRSRHEYNRAIELINYYRFANIPLRYSYFSKLTIEDQRKILSTLKKSQNTLVDILSFALMPNHFHFLLKQTSDNGIEYFISRFTNSYTKYVNIQFNRVGPLFQGRYKSVHIEADAHLMHLSRYIHLNPYTDGIVKTLDDLFNYPYTSLLEHVENNGRDFIQTDTVLSLFKNKLSYKMFIKKQADYQKKLGSIKKLILEKPSKLVPNHPRRA